LGFEQHIVSADTVQMCSYCSSVALSCTLPTFVNSANQDRNISLCQNTNSKHDYILTL
jgi:hypothetical protein